MMANQNLEVLSTRQDAPASQKLAHIDSLRGIAILMVIFVHTAQSVPDLPRWVVNIASYGQLGVQLFFVLSALTLSVSMTQRWGEKDRVKKYFIRRIFRIAPLYYAGILWYFIFLSARVSWQSGEFHIAESYTLVNVLANVFFAHGFYPPAHNYVVPGGWSIGTEMAFYACFPLLFLGFKKMSEKGAVKFLGAFILLTFVYYALEFGYILWAGAPVRKNNFMYYNLLNQLPVFALGLFAYFLPKGRGALLPLYGLGLFLFAGLTDFLWRIDLPVVNSFMLLPFVSGAAFVFLYYIFASIRWLNVVALQKIGQASYSMYIFHFMFAWYGTEYLHAQWGFIGRPLVLFGAYYLLTVALAYTVALASEKYIEKPGIALGRRIIQNMDDRAR